MMTSLLMLPATMNNLLLVLKPFCLVLQSSLSLSSPLGSTGAEGKIDSTNKTLQLPPPYTNWAGGGLTASDP